MALILAHNLKNYKNYLYPHKFACKCFQLVLATIEIRKLLRLWDF